MKKARTHKQIIRDILLEGGSVTGLDALREFGCYRLASRISDLRREGLAITKTMEGVSEAAGRPVRFARYSLDQAMQRPKQSEGK